MNYTLHQLMVFRKIVETASITKAAEELHLTQPAVSIQLKNFQDQFEIPLTEVVGRKIHVTDFGHEIAIAVERIVNEVETINFKANEFKGKLTGKLKISIVSTGKYVMPYFLTDFMKLHPGVELKMDVTNKAKVLESLENNEVDFALVSILPEHLLINKLGLLPNKLYLVGNKDQKFAKKTNDKKILESLPVIFREQGSGTRYIMEKFIATHHLKVQRSIELTSNEAVKQAVLAGLGYSVMPLIGIKQELSKGDLQIIPINGLPIRTNWNLIWLKGKAFLPVAKTFLEYLNKEKNTIVEKYFQQLQKY